MPDSTEQIVYYNSQRSVLLSLFQWHGTVFKMVLLRFEFWVFLFVHICFITVCIIFLPNTKVVFNWKLMAGMQYLMTFFITFYNSQCFERFKTLYPLCNELVNSTIRFTQEMTTSLPDPSLDMHRTAMSKYLLVVVFEYFMMVTGGKPTPDNWKMLKRKGLLTEAEAEMLSMFPGGKATFVVTTWVLQILRHALEQDVMWIEGKSQQTMHVYNRHNQHMTTLLGACLRIGDLMAMPIPFVYYHLMNVILTLNIMLLILLPALFRTYMTVFPASVALLIYMGLREVAAALADPFGQDPTDFPIAAFINQGFDHAICILEAFALPEVKQCLLERLEHVEDFSSRALARPCRAEILYDSNLADEDVPGWRRPACLEALDETTDIKTRIQLSLLPRHHPVVASRKVKKESKFDKDPPEMEQLQTELDRRDALRIKKADLEVELLRIRQMR